MEFEATSSKPWGFSPIPALSPAWSVLAWSVLTWSAIDRREDLVGGYRHTADAHALHPSDGRMLSNPRRLPGLAIAPPPAWEQLMANRKAEKLIDGWHAADVSRRHTVLEYQRGYNARYSKPDLERDRADDEAKAAANMAREILNGRILKSG